MEWISVRDKLPNSNVQVVVHGFLGFDIAQYVEGERMGWINSDWSLVRQVTHWMPLPEEPNESN